MFSVLGRSSSTEKLYDMEESSMDEIGDFGQYILYPPSFLVDLIPVLLLLATLHHEL